MRIGAVLVASMLAGTWTLHAWAADSDTAVASRWVLRASVGPAYFVDSAQTDPVLNRFYGRMVARGTIHGAGVSGELAGGYALSEPWVLGVSVGIHVFPAPKSDDPEITNVDTGMVMARSPELRYEFDPSYLFTATPYIAYNTNGFVFEGGLGLGWRQVGKGTDPMWSAGNLESQSGGGPILHVGAGYAIPVKEAWSIGVLGRLMASYGTDHAVDGTAWRHWLFLPALLISLSYGGIAAR